MPDDQYLEKIMREYGDSILRMCYLYLKDYHLAEDAAQETFIKAMKAHDSFKNESSEKTWLIRIAINCCKNIRRTKWFQLAQFSAQEYLQADDSNPVEEFLEKDSLSNAIMKLSVNDRQLIVLYYYQELSVKEIAEVVGKKENAILQGLNRARKRLKKMIGGLE